MYFLAAEHNPPHIHVIYGDDAAEIAIETGEIWRPFMFHKVKNINPLPGFKLSVLFSEGVTKIYDIEPLFEKIPAFKELQEKPELFYEVQVDVGGYGIVWSDKIDLACDELYANGTQIDTPFDNLMSFGDATELWGLSESTLRKAVEYGRLINGVDVCKYGKQWIITMDAMRREYGDPKV